MDSLLKRMLAVEQEATVKMKAAESAATTKVSQAKEEARVRVDQARSESAAAGKARIQAQIAAAEAERAQALNQAETVLACVEQEWQGRLETALPAALHLFRNATPPAATATGSA